MTRPSLTNMDALSYYLAKENNSKDKIIELLKASVMIESEKVKRACIEIARTLTETQQLRIELEIMHDQVRELARYAGSLERQNLRLTSTQTRQGIYRRQEEDSESEPEIEIVRRTLNYDTDEEVDRIRERERENRYNTD